MMSIRFKIRCCVRDDKFLRLERFSIEKVSSPGRVSRETVRSLDTQRVPRLGRVSIRL